MGKRKKKAARKPRRTVEQQIADLEAEIERLRQRSKELSAFSPEMVREERERLELSATDYAQLVGVSHLTIYAWEQGRSKPRQKQLEQWLEVQGIGKKEAWDALGLKRPPGGFSPESVYEERKRLELSAADYGKLVGVSALTIYNWEKGKTKPQQRQLEALLKVKGIGKRAAWKQLGY